MERIRKQDVRLNVEQIVSQVPADKKDAIRACLEPFSKKGYLDLEKKFRGVLFTSPLRVVKHVLEGEGSCRINLKVEWNSDMGPNQFINDVFGIVIDSSGNTVAVTSRQKNGAKPGSTFIVMGLGTNANVRSARSDKHRVELTTDDHLSKRFKMTLMNVFDMFDFDCDGLLSRDEYSAFAIATADTPPDDECEAFSGDDLAVPDIWESLYRLGYDSNLQLHYVGTLAFLAVHFNTN
ncbi:unnamed protein product [Strongylus vulgaris]|uniref:EF-hand domain-containing protein n=1 Tax=Strongylus vulgaris TaxID=40348 RepID=A0A3P7J2W8_STRVU|nr:unnamed protein product [Strongylus vulgaris]